MADRSLIEWTDATWNPVTGCTPVSVGCTNCYASRMVKRFPHLHNASIPPTMAREEDFREVLFHPSRLDQPLRWKKPRRIFVCSMGDLFHEDVKEEWLTLVFMTMAAAQRHTFMILTKRPTRMMDFMTQAFDATHIIPPHVWLGVTAENQEMADQRIPILLQTPAAKRFVSVEPMLGPVDLRALMDYCPEHDYVGGFCIQRTHPGVRRLDWIICGGESGPGARPMALPWAQTLRDQCRSAGVPFFFKGWGTHHMKKSDPNYMKIDGKEWKEFPEVKI